MCPMVPNYSAIVVICNVTLPYCTEHGLIVSLFRIKKDRQYTYHVTMRGVRLAMVAVEKQ